MKDYFLLSGENPHQVATAYARGIPPVHELILNLEGLNELPFELNLLKSTKGKNELELSDDLSGLENIWKDYQLNNLGWPFCSQRLKQIIDEQLTGDEMVDWVEAKVNGYQEQRIYYIPRFNKENDVLDMKKTWFVDGTDHIIRPVFAFSKINNYSIFSIPSSDNLWKITSRVFVNSKLKMKIQKARLSGIKFEKAMVD